MSKGAVSFKGENIEYYTPKSVVDIFGAFDYDPATNKEQVRYLGIKNYDTIETDGLKSDWTKHKHIWINPPFSKKHLFWDKACATFAIAHNDICFLCPIEFLTTRRFQNAIRRHNIGARIYIPNGSIKFQSGVGANESAPAFGSVILQPHFCDEVKLFNLDLTKERVTA